MAASGLRRSCTMELDSRPMVEMRSWRISSARALWMEAHMALKVPARRPSSSSLETREPEIVILARDLGGGAVELLDRLDDPARQQIRQPKADDHGAEPGQGHVAAQRGDPLARAFERTENPQLADRLAFHVDQRLLERRVFGHAVADAAGAFQSAGNMAQSARRWRAGSAWRRSRVPRPGTGIRCRRWIS